MPTYSERLLGGTPSVPAAPATPSPKGSYSSRLLGGSAIAQPSAPAAVGPAPSFAQSMGQGFSDFALLGYADEAEAALRAGLGGEDYETAVADVRQRQEQAGTLPYYLGAGAALFTPGGLGTLAAKGVRALTPSAARVVGPRAAPYVAGGAVGAAEGGVAATGMAEGTIPERLAAAPVGAATGTVGGVVGETIGRGMTRFANRRLARDIEELDPVEAQALARQAEQHGIQLTPAELTGLPSLEQQQKLLGNTPGASEILARFYQGRARGQIEPAIERFLDEVGPFTGEGAAEKFQEAAKRGFQRLAEERAAKASPIYQRAFNAGVSVDVKPVLKEIDAISKRFPPEGKVNRTLNGIRKLLTVKLRNEDPATRALLQEMAPGRKLPERLPNDDLQVLHGAKLEIDDLIAAARIKTEKGGGKTIISVLQSVQERLLGQMDKASKDYTTARGIFSDISPGVDQVREGVAGIIANLRGPQLRLAAGKLFDKSTATVTETLRAKKLIEQNDPAAWRGISRLWLEDQWIKALQQRGATDAAPVNAGAIFRKNLLGNRRQRALLQAALEPDQFRALDDLTGVLAAAGRVKRMGSDTAYNQEAQRALRRDSRGVLSRVIGALNPSVLRDVSDFMDQRGYEEHTRNLARIITSPGGVELVRELKRIAPNAEFQRAVLGYAAGIGTTIEASRLAAQGGGPADGANAQILPGGGLAPAGSAPLAAVAPAASNPQGTEAGGPGEAAAILSELQRLRDTIGSRGTGAAAQAQGMSPEELALRRDELQMRQLEAKNQIEAQNDMMRQQIEILRMMAERAEAGGGEGQGERSGNGRKRSRILRDELGRIVDVITDELE